MGLIQHPSHQDKRGFSDSFYYLGFTYSFISFFSDSTDKLTIGANTASLTQF